MAPSDSRQDLDPQRMERLRQACDRLREVLTDVAKTIEAKKHERCPYRTAKDLCTYRGGCVNKQREGHGHYRCGGDHMLRWK